MSSVRKGWDTFRRRDVSELFMFYYVYESMDTVQFLDDALSFEDDTTKDKARTRRVQNLISVGGGTGTQFHPSILE